MVGVDAERPTAGPHPPTAAGDRTARRGSTGPAGAGPATAEAIDASRVRSFIGLSIGLVGPRANLAVSGVLITLFVQQRASGALAVTFALTADRLVSWLTYPVAGRLSDRTRSRVGRRTPYMAGSLIVMGVATWMFTVVSGYWAARADDPHRRSGRLGLHPDQRGRGARGVRSQPLDQGAGPHHGARDPGQLDDQGDGHHLVEADRSVHVEPALPGGRRDHGVAVGMAVLLLVREAPCRGQGAAGRPHGSGPGRPGTSSATSWPDPTPRCS